MGKLQRGETLLVTATAGATGHFAAQLGRLEGCRVVATCGGPEKADRLRALGLDRVIDYTQEVGPFLFYCKKSCVLMGQLRALGLDRAMDYTWEVR